MNELSCVKKNFINYINNAIKNNKISHAYLIEVDNYNDDFNYVLSFIKMIFSNLSYDNLTDSDNKICHLIDAGNYPDLSIISTDTNVINKSLITGLQTEFSNKSLFGDKRIYVINEAEKLNAFSANTLLKFLEEPEDNIIAFILTDNRYHVFDTILSRCQVLSLKEDTFELIFNENFVDFLDSVLNPQNMFINYKSVLSSFFTDKMVIKNELKDVENIIINYLKKYDTSNSYYQLLSKKNNNELINIISIIEDEIPKLDFNVNLKLWVDSFYSKLIGG